MDWKEICIHTLNEAIEPVSHMLLELEANGVVIDDPKMLEYNDALGERYELNPNKYPSEGVYIKAYFPADEEFDVKLDKIKLGIERLQGLDIPLGKAMVTQEDVKETDWENEWKKFFKPVRISENIAI